MCLERVADVLAAGSTRHRWAFPRVDPVADLQTTSAAENGDVGTMQSQRLSDKGLNLNVH